MSEAGERMLEGAREAVAIAKGEHPAASIWIKGHRYMPAITRRPVECVSCGWTGRRKPGNIVICPKCGGIAGFQSK